MSNFLGNLTRDSMPSAGAPITGGDVAGFLGDAVGSLTGRNSSKITRTKIVGDIFALGNEDKFYFIEGEAPEAFPEGGEQMHALHQFPGGERTIDVFGAQPVDIEFSGELHSVAEQKIQVAGGIGPAQAVTINAATAKQRSDQLRLFYQNTVPVQLRFGHRKYLGVVVFYKASLHNENHVTYELKFKVLEDGSDDLAPSRARHKAQNPPPFIQLVQLVTEYSKKATRFVQTANAVVSVAKVIKIQLQKDPTKVFKAGVSMLPGASDVVDTITALDRLKTNVTTFASTSNPQTQLDLANAKPYQTLAPSAINKVLVPQVNGTRTVLSAITNDTLNTFQSLRIQGQRTRPDLIASTVRDGQQLAALLALISMLFKRLASTQHTTVLTLQNPNLIALALKYYGRADKWTIIAERNNLKVPYPTGTYQLVIPREARTSSLSGLGDVTGSNV